MSTLMKQEKAYAKIVKILKNYILYESYEHMYTESNKYSPFKEDHICTNIYSEATIQTNQKIIDKIDTLLKKYEISIHSIEVWNLPMIILSIYNLMHPMFIQYLKDSTNGEDTVEIPTFGIYRKLPNIYNSENNHVHIKNAINDMLSWMYTTIYHDVICTANSDYISKDQQFALLDEYAKIFNVTYEKITYD